MRDYIIGTYPPVIVSAPCPALGSGDITQGPTQAKQVLYHRIAPPISSHPRVVPLLGFPQCFHVNCAYLLAPWGCFALVGFLLLQGSHLRGDCFDHFLKLLMNCELIWLLF